MADDGCGGHVACGECDFASCQTCVNGQCVVCGGDDRQVCCQGGCIPADACCFNDKCIGQDDQRHAGICQDHACVARVQLGRNCDDGLACVTGSTCQADGTCGGTPVDCDDGLSCTVDTCNTDTGGCEHAIVSDTCLIVNACFRRGDLNPENPCEICDPDFSQLAWAYVDVDTVCAAASCDGTTFTSQATCDGKGTCQRATPMTCTAELSCATSTYDVKKGCVVGTINPGFCVIEGAYVPARMQVGRNCMGCFPDQSTTSLTNAQEGFPCAVPGVEGENSCTGGPAGENECFL